MTLLRQFPCFKLFVTSLALASKVDNYKGKGAVSGRTSGDQATSVTGMQSGDCFNQKLKGDETDLSQKSPSACITFCQDFLFAGISNTKCTCGNEYPNGRKDNTKCLLPCPGPDLNSKCDTTNLWWNVFSTLGNVLNFSV